MKIAISILSCDIKDELEVLDKINNTDADLLHVDITDGSFVPNLSPKWENLHLSKKPLSVHLMVSRPFDYITKYSLLNTDVITIHIELEDDIQGLLNHIKSSGIKCGLAVSPNTPIYKLKDYLDIVDEILILTVYPGRGGQKLLEEVTYKIDDLIELRKNNGYHYKIVVDGGVNEDTIKLVNKADIIVSGSFVTESDDYQSRIDKLRL